MKTSIVPRFRTLATALLCSLSAALPAAGQDGVQVSSADYVELTFLDVGQGDAVLIRSPGGSTVLVDAGGDAGIVGLLRRAGVDRIDQVIASHAHADHIGGMTSVLDSFDVGAFMDNGIFHTTDTYLDVIRAVDAAGIPYDQASAQTLALGPVKLSILDPPSTKAVTGDLQNDNSIGVVIELGDFRALLTGDSEVDELNHWLRGGVPTVTVLKAAHHGARNGVTPAWLSATKPDVVVISSGAGNPYGHPSPWALRYFDAMAQHVLRTDLSGNVTIRGYPDGSYDILLQYGKVVREY